MKQRWFFLCAVLVLAMMAIPNFAEAKAAEQSYCDVMEADACEIIAESAEAMEDVTSMVSFTEMAILARDMPEVPLSVIGFNYEQETATVLSDRALELINDTRAMSPADAEEMFNDPVALIEYYEELLQEVAMSIDMRIQLSDEVKMIADMAVQQELGVPLPDTIELSLVFVDGIAYADLASVSDFIPGMGGMLQGWAGAEMAPLFELAKEEAANQGNINNVQLDGSLDSINMSPTGPLVAQIGAFDLSNQFIQFLDITREDDGVIDGEDVAVIRTEFDFDAFFESPIFRELFLQIMAEQGEMDVEELSEAEIDEMITMVQFMGPVVLQDLILDHVEGISLGSGHLLSREFLMEWDMTNVLQMAAASGEFSMPAGAEPFFGMETSTYMEQINEGIEIVAPEGALVLPVAMLLGQ